jgi:hypothetical protein
MADWNQQDQGGKKSEYLGNHTYTTEAGHVVEFDNTPGDCRIHIYHKSGTFVEIKDDGAMITTAKGGRQDFNDKGRDEVTTGEFNLTVNGPINIYCTGNVIQHVDGNYELNIGGDLKVKVGGNELREVIGDQRTQVNGKTAHRTSGNRDEVTGGNKTETNNNEYFQSTGTESTVISGGNYAVLAGEDFQAIATKQVGIGAGTQMGLASADIMKLQSQTQIQTRAVTGTFIRDSYAILVESSGSGGTVVAASGYKAGIFSKDHDVRIGSGGKLLVETDDGSKIDTASTIPGVGGFYPT